LGFDSIVNKRRFRAHHDDVANSARSMRILVAICSRVARRFWISMRLAATSRRRKRADPTQHGYDRVVRAAQSIVNMRKERDRGTEIACVKRASAEPDDMRDAETLQRRGIFGRGYRACDEHAGFAHYAEVVGG
jgi:hypothetical protein